MTDKEGNAQKEGQKLHLLDHFDSWYFGAFIGLLFALHPR
jgi:hypothetical protein